MLWPNEGQSLLHAARRNVNTQLAMEIFKKYIYMNHNETHDISKHLNLADQK